MAATKKVTTDTWTRLTHGYHFAQKQCRSALRGSGLTHPQYEVLAQIAGEEGIPLTRIGEKLLVTGGNITGIVDRLERDGLVKRKRDKEDRRIIRAFFTAKGKRLYQQASPAYDRFLKKAFGDLSSADHGRLQKALDNLLKDAE